MNLYERLASLITLHHWDNGWWAGVEHELWILREQRRIYGAAATLSDNARQAVMLMLEATGQSPDVWQDVLGDRVDTEHLYFKAAA